MTVSETIKNAFNQLKTWQKALVVLVIFSLIVSPFIPEEEKNKEDEATRKWNERKQEVTRQVKKEEKPMEKAPEKSTVSEKEETVVPLEKPAGFSMINQTSMANYKHTINIRLEKKRTKEELEKIAKYLKAQVKQKFERVLMLYYLPDMPPGEGAWATTHYEGESLSVRIMDFMAN
ncbi:hypothetical protein [Microscilla marina]|uniref:Uncharacterized protein n=1 Tax=Microscilla marina ATCC 23134 TaxID=313606 RepID=A1ZIJ0_MICM2|nr:hypothetical protein [Microscilla marina]EAY29858.1 hypothetical protein M23134_05731 [Microscilla marina ATCC 23134]